MVTLKQWMDANGLSNSELAARLGVSYQSIYKMSEGLRPVSSGVKYRIAMEYGIDAAERIAPNPAQVAKPEPA